MFERNSRFEIAGKRSMCPKFQIQDGRFIDY